MQYPEIESSILEFKREIPRNNQITKTAIGFCNLHGGQIIIGVADDRTIMGLTEQEIEEAMEFVEISIFKACTPNILPRLYIQRFADKSVLVVEISEGMNKPYYLHSEGLTKGTYIRLGRHTMHANAEIVQELKWQSSGIDYERLPVYGATMTEMSKNKINQFLKARKNHSNTKITDHLLKSYGLIANDQSTQYPSTLGILAFSTEPQIHFPEAMIMCTHFRGVSGRDALATIDCTGDIFEQFNKAFTFIIDRLYYSFSITGLQRKEVLEIPEIAIREALLNAVAHRNYYIKAPIKIAIYSDRIEFFSPGQFPGPIHINNLESGISYFRNPILCKILRESHYIEKMGTGFITIFESYKKTNLKTPQIIEGENFIKCILPREINNNTKKGLHDELEKILNLFRETKEIKVNDVMNHLSVSRATAVRRLNDLIKLGEIERKGNTTSVVYRKI